MSYSPRNNWTVTNEIIEFLETHPEFIDKLVLDLYKSLCNQINKKKYICDRAPDYFSIIMKDHRNLCTF